MNDGNHGWTMLFDGEARRQGQAPTPVRRSENTYPTARWGLVGGKGSKKGLQPPAPCLVIVIKLEVSLEWLDVLAGYRCESLQVYVLTAYSLPPATYWLHWLQT